MKNQWSDREAQTAVSRGDDAGISEDLALRLYSARLLGQDRSLVLHGGGNASLKADIKDPIGETLPAMYIKGSGRDMGCLEADGMPAIKLMPLQRLRTLSAPEDLDDLAMVNLLRGSMLDAGGPAPSVETLLHAFLPQAYVDHTHASAVLALTNQPNGEDICGEVFGEHAAVAPYAMSGLALAKATIDACEGQPGCRGIILSKHGLVSFGKSAAASYQNMMDLVDMAERHLNWGRRKIFPSIALPVSMPSASEIGPILRSVLAQADDSLPGGYRRVVLDHRCDDEVMNYVNGQDLSRYSRAGVVTPDHAIRTKGRPLVLPAPDRADMPGFAEEAGRLVADFCAAYEAYFQRHSAKDTIMLNPMPNVVLVPGVGLFSAARTFSDATITADIAASAMSVIAAAEDFGEFESIPEKDLFDIEYWSLEQAKLEQAKLGRNLGQEFAGHVVAVTGGAGAIGAAASAAFAAMGAVVVVLDLDGERAAEVATTFGGLGLACDVTDAASVGSVFETICATYGGIDIIVSNAGAAWQGKIGEVSDELLRRSFELNFFAHQLVAKTAVGIMARQGTGGVLLFNASKQAVNPGPDFGPYGLPKAATLSLMRQYAVDYGAQGIRSNAVNADRIRSGLLTDRMVAARSKARGVSEANYMAGNLLGREVRAEDVAQAFVALARAEKTTGAALTVDGGNIAAALR